MIMKPRYLDAVYKLLNDKVHGGNMDGTISEIKLHDGQTPPTEEAIQTKLAELHTEYDAQEYARNRATAFPSIGDQLDMQYHDQLDGTTTWKDAIAKVKSDNPKE